MPKRFVVILMIVVLAFVGLVGVLGGMNGRLYVATASQSENFPIESGGGTTPHAPNWVGPSIPIFSDQDVFVRESRPYIYVAPNGTKLLAVYNRQIGASNDRDPYFSRSINYGQTWSTPAPIYSSPGAANNSLEVNLAIDDSGTGHAVWVESDATLLYLSEPDWDVNSPTMIATADIEVSSPQIVAAGTVLHIIWTATNFSPGLPQVFHRQSMDGGASWSTETVISPNAPQATPVHVAVDNSGNLNVVWEQLSDIDPLMTYIYYTKGTVSGSTVSWSDAVRIGDVEATNRSARRPRILVENSNLHVAFTAYSSDDAQWIHYVSCSTNCEDDLEWSADINVSGTAVGINANVPKYITSDIFQISECIYVYFHGIDDMISTNELIMGVNSCDNWSSSGRDNSISDPQNQALHVSVAAIDEFVQLVYTELINGTSQQIYYIAAYQVTPIPTPGGQITTGGTTTFTIPANTFTDTVIVSYQLIDPIPSPPDVDLFFELTAVYSSTGQPAQLAPGQTINAAVRYQRGNVPAGVCESHLSLLRWNPKLGWMPNPSSTVNTNDTTVTAELDELGVNAILGEYCLHLPGIMR